MGRRATLLIIYDPTEVVYEENFGKDTIKVGWRSCINELMVYLHDGKEMKN